MPAVKSYKRRPSKRHQVHRPSLSLHRFFLASGFIAIAVLWIWIYFNASLLTATFLTNFEKYMSKIGFTLEDVVVEGRTRTDKGHILSLLKLSRGASLFALDLPKAREKLETVPWIKAAHVERKLPHTLLIRLVEKDPVSLWQHQGKFYLMDRDGDLLATKEPYQYKELPIVTGEKAPHHIEELCELLAQVPPLQARITGATYLSSGRWDLKLDHAIDIKLPEKTPEKALTYLLKLENTHHFINEDIVIIDLRIPGQLILRLTPEAVKKKKSKGKNA